MACVVSNDHVADDVIWSRKVKSRPSYIWIEISRKPFETEAWYQLPTNRKWPMVDQMMSRDRDPCAKSDPIFWFPAPHCLFTMILLGGSEEDLWVFNDETANATAKSSENFLNPDPLLVVFWGVGVKWYKNFTFLLQKAHPCPNPRLLSHFAWRSMCSWKKAESHRT